MTNPLDTTPFTYSVSVSSPDYIAYNSTVQVLPLTQPIVFSSNYSLTSSVVLTVSNLSVQLSKSVATEISVSLPATLLSKVNNCYLNSLKLSNYTTTNTTTAWKIIAQGVDLTNGGVFTLEIVTYPYSVTIQDYLNVTMKLPVSLSSIPLSITLKPRPLTASFISTSLAVSVKANYTLSFTLLSS